LAWQVFQYLIITCAEILISITGLEFAYKQAPIRMKSLLQACWLLTTAMGNVINTFMSKFSTNGNARDKEFFFLSLALLVAAGGMTYLGMLYKYTTPEELEEINNCPDKHGESEASEEKQQLKMKRMR
jgi:dipeptide/tripeptide permease